MDINQTKPVFTIKDCSISNMATGISVGSLVDFRERILTINLESLYYHFFVTRLRPHFGPSTYNNDFALWACKALNDVGLAERLNVLDPLRFNSLEELRESLVNVIDRALDEKDFVVWTKRSQFFHFLTAKIVVTDTLNILHEPQELPGVIDCLSTGSLFFHFINARRHHHASLDDISLWLSAFDGTYQPLINQLVTLDVYFLSLVEIKHKLSLMVHDFFR